MFQEQRWLDLTKIVNDDPQVNIACLVNFVNENRGGLDRGGLAISALVNIDTWLERG